MLLLVKLVVHFENIRRLPWNGGLLCMQRWLSTWASNKKILTPQASYLLLLLWGKWLWLLGTCSNLEGTCKHKQMMSCAVLSWCKRCTVMLLKLQWSIWAFKSSFNDCHQHQCHLQHHAHIGIGAHLQDVTSWCTSMALLPDSETWFSEGVVPEVQDWASLSRVGYFPFHPCPLQAHPQGVRLSSPLSPREGAVPVSSIMGRTLHILLILLRSISMSLPQIVNAALSDIWYAPAEYYTDKDEAQLCNETLSQMIAITRKVCYNLHYSIHSTSSKHYNNLRTQICKDAEIQLAWLVWPHISTKKPCRGIETPAWQMPNSKNEFRSAHSMLVT